MLYSPWIKLSILASAGIRYAVWKKGNPDAIALLPALTACMLKMPISHEGTAE
jgi:hypothetical protein